MVAPRGIPADNPAPDQISGMQSEIQALRRAMELAFEATAASEDRAAKHRRDTAEVWGLVVDQLKNDLAASKMETQVLRNNYRLCAQQSVAAATQAA